MQPKAFAYCFYVFCTSSTDAKNSEAKQSTRDGLDSWCTTSSADSDRLCSSDEQDLPHPAVPVEEGRAALYPCGPNGTSGWRTDTNTGAGCKGKCPELRISCIPIKDEVRPTHSRCVNSIGLKMESSGTSLTMFFLMLASASANSIVKTQPSTLMNQHMN